MVLPPTSAVRIVEVGPRDGLQNIATFVPTKTKLGLIRRLEKTGLRAIELTSAVSPKAVPQLADCREILCSELIANWLQTKAECRLSVLVPNIKGLEIALRCGVKELAVFVSATEGFSQANINCSVDEGLRRAKSVAVEAIANGLAVRGYVSCIFADPFDGPTSPAAVYRVARDLLDIGCYEISIADTLGVGTPSQVQGLIKYLNRRGVNSTKLACHFHDTYGQALANVWEAYTNGVRVFDSSVGGLGGCPFAPRASGNVATHDVVRMFENAGIDTGVNLQEISDVGVWIFDQLHELNHNRTENRPTLSSYDDTAITRKGGSTDRRRLSWSSARKTDDAIVMRRSWRSGGVLGTETALEPTCVSASGCSLGPLGPL